MWSFIRLLSIEPFLFYSSPLQPQFLPTHYVQELCLRTFTSNVIHLARSDIKPKRTRVIILEEAQARSRCSAQLIAYSLSSKAGKSRYDSRRSGCNSLNTDVGLDAAHRWIGGGLAGDSAELRQVNLAISREGEWRCLKLRLLWEEEHQRASPRWWSGNVDVEDRRSVRGLSELQGHCSSKIDLKKGTCWGWPGHRLVSPCLGSFISVRCGRDSTFVASVFFLQEDLHYFIRNLTTRLWSWIYFIWISYDDSNRARRVEAAWETFRSEERAGLLRLSIVRRSRSRT